MKEQLAFETAALTDAGLVRKNNEDRVLAVEQPAPNGFAAHSAGIYLIADGMGGCQAGEVASEMAKQIISHSLLESLKNGHNRSEPFFLLKHAIERANHEIIRLARRIESLRCMGTTATVGLRLDDTLYIGHVGDSRAYLIRNKTIQQLTEDHSVVAQMVKEGIITLKEAAKHAEKGMLLRCLGGSAVVVVETKIQELQEGDSIVFCSDGLTAHIRENEILRIVTGGKSANESGNTLIRLANSRGGEDNSSVIVVKVTVK